MVSLRLLLYALLVTILGAVLVVWGGTVVLPGSQAPDALWYLAVAFVSLLCVIPIWKREQNDERSI
ncbi:hypothetical protein OB905_06450 [Halobacteria archaeon AArc-dxtr1]|nr:hypothetical protein [Halobacteria archaeon AArc-dxtr1]